jgi:hypothetical protein
VAVRSKASTVFARLNTEIVTSNPTWSMDVSVRLFCVCAVLCDGLISRPRSPTDYVKDQETEKSSQGPTKGCRDIGS